MSDTLPDKLGTRALSDLSTSSGVAHITYLLTYIVMIRIQLFAYTIRLPY